MQGPRQTPKFGDCLKACNACHKACNDATRACIESPQVKRLMRCIMLNRDCGLFCSTAAMLLEHGSEFLPQVIKLCIDACETCAAENERSDLRPCRQAAEACRCFVRECRKTNAI
jgi:hypothetical protein